MAALWVFQKAAWKAGLLADVMEKMWGCQRVEQKAPKRAAMWVGPRAPSMAGPTEAKRAAMWVGPRAPSMAGPKVDP